MDRRGHARTFSGQALLAFGKPHLPSELRCPDLRIPSGSLEQRHSSIFAVNNLLRNHTWSICWSRTAATSRA